MFTLQVEENDLKFIEPETNSNPRTALETLRNSMNIVYIEEETEKARAEDRQAQDDTREQGSHMGNNFADVVVSIFFSSIKGKRSVKNQVI